MKYLSLMLISACIIAVSCTGNNSDSAMSDITGQADHRAFDAKGHTCNFCGETIKNNRFGGMIETRNGDELLFGSIECVAGHLLKNPGIVDDNSAVWVADYHAGERIVPVEKARYLRTELLNSPNDLKLIAYTGKEDLDDSFKIAYGGESLNWDGVLMYVNRHWAINEE